MPAGAAESRLVRVFVCPLVCAANPSCGAYGGVCTQMAHKILGCSEGPHRTARTRATKWRGCDGVPYARGCTRMSAGPTLAQLICAEWCRRARLVGCVPERGDAPRWDGARRSIAHDSGEVVGRMLRPAGGCGVPRAGRRDVGTGHPPRPAALPSRSGRRRAARASLSRPASIWMVHSTATLASTFAGAGMRDAAHHRR